MAETVLYASLATLVVVLVLLDWFDVLPASVTKALYAALAAASGATVAYFASLKQTHESDVQPPKNLEEEPYHDPPEDDVEDKPRTDSGLGDYVRDVQRRYRERREEL